MVAAIVIVLAGAGVAAGLARSGGTRPHGSVPPVATTSSTSPTTVGVAKGSRPTFAEVVRGVRFRLRSGHLPGAGPVADAVVRCPRPVAIRPGRAFACRVASKQVGHAVLVIEVTSTSGRYRAFIGNALACHLLTRAGRRALRLIGAYCN